MSDFSKLGQYLDSLQDLYGMPMGDLCIMQDHEVIYRHSYGYADLARKVPVGKDHLYRLYSATKPITMTAVLQLIERGKLGFDDLLKDYLPEYEKMTVADDFAMESYGNVVGQASVHPARNAIRIIDLMTMTAGFSYDTADPNIAKLVKESGGTATTREIIAALAKTPLLYEPGTRWCYSLSHDVLAAVVEVVSGMRFSDYLRTQIFEPLGAGDFYFHTEDDPETAARICDIYQGVNDRPPFVEAEKSYRDQYCFTPHYDSGGAGLIASVDAYSLFADALACKGTGRSGQQILSPDLVAGFSRAYTLSGAIRDDFDRLNRTGYEYGLGVRVLVDDSRAKSPVGEFGWDGAAGAYVLIDTKHRLSAFYAEHVLGFSDNYDVIHPQIRDLIYEGLSVQ